MLADELDYVIGVDPHRDAHAFAVVHVRSGGVVFEARRSGGKTDALDAIRAARSVLAQQRPAAPRASGEREALRALIAAREGAVNAKRAGLCQLRDLLVTAPEPLRGELRGADPVSTAAPPRSRETRTSPGS
jgi:transposase